MSFFSKLFSGKTLMATGVFLPLLTGFCKKGTAQNLQCIRTAKEYKVSVKTSYSNKLQDIQKLLPALVLDLKYNRSDNFTHVNLYRKATTTYLRMPAALALQKATETLKEKGYSFKIFDAYRPYSVTRKMWELIGDERYVANPKNGSNHNKGLAIDLTIIQQDGRELDMGTAFDNFSDTAHHDFTKLPATVLENRKLLRTLMEQNGFRALETEWWHYSFSTTENFQVMDLSFKTLKKLNR
jgi:D-alanyl-D-alanine dipeptidase